LRAWNKSTEIYFKPIAAIPSGSPVQSEAYASGLRHTIDLLQHEASDASVSLPPKYDFSFTAERPLVKFAPGSLELLAVQLGEVKTICEILFAAHINALDGIQREKVSADDASGPQSDYLGQQTTTNEIACVTPYVVTFRCFTPELAKVVSSFTTCSNAFIIKSVNVLPAVASSPAGAANPAPATDSNSGQPVAAVPSPAAGSKGGLQTVLKEQLLRVTMELELVKLLPKS